MKRILFTALASSLLLSACGNRPEDVVVVDTEALVAAEAVAGLSVSATSNQSAISTGSGTVAVITARVTDVGNRTVANAPVTFTATSGALENFSSETDDNGQAVAELSLAGSFKNETILVGVVTGASSQEVLVEASGTTVNLAGASSVVLGDPAVLTATLTDGTGEAIANQPVFFRSATGNNLSASSVITNSDGQAQVTVSSNFGDDVITASAFDQTVIGSHQLTVAQDILTFSNISAGHEFEVDSQGRIVVEWLSNNQPVVGQTLRMGITAGQIIDGETVTTDVNGKAVVKVQSSSAGPATLSAAAASGGDPATQIAIEFVATTPDTAIISATATRVPTLDNATITAKVIDANGNPVKNREVVFASNDLKGGQLNPASAMTNSDGEAITTFKAGVLPTEFNEITIDASVLDTNVAGALNLTVVERVLNVTLGTSGLLDVIASETQYGLPFAVQVADGGGTPIENAIIEVSLLPVQYEKGMFVLSPSDAPTEWAKDPSVTCAAEDANGNRILDVEAGEDINNNGVLDPQDPASIAASQTNIPTVEGGQITTDANGSGYFTLLYPASSARWSYVQITARAKALGSEASEVFVTTLPMLASRKNDVDASPPNRVSPYGISGSCADED